MQISVSENPAKAAAKELADAIFLNLSKEKQVLVLLAGGSANDVYDLVPDFLKGDDLSGLMLIMGDERWNPDPKHSDSDWQHFKQTRFYEFAKERGAKLIDILSGRSLDSETADFGKLLQNAITDNFYLIAQLGIGPDGHTAGITPGGEEEFREVYDTEKLAVSQHLDSKHRDRITISLAMLDYVDTFILFAKGEQKKSVLQMLVESAKWKSEKRLEQLHTYPVLYLADKSAKLFTDQKINS